MLPSEVFEGELKRDVGLRGLTMISLGSIIGSGWLLGALGAAQSAGPASLLSWILAGSILGVLALVHAELGSTYPLSGGTARFPFLSFGALGGFTGGWMAWIQAVTIAPIEVEAALTYLESTSLHPGFVHANGTLTGIRDRGRRRLHGGVHVHQRHGRPVAGGVEHDHDDLEARSADAHDHRAADRLLQRQELHRRRWGSLRSAPRASSPRSRLGWYSPSRASSRPFRSAASRENPQHDIHRAVIISMVIGTVLYLLLEVAFIGALNPKDIAHNWLNPIPGQGSFGPYATLATSAGVGWLATILYIDAVISPAGTGLVYSGTSARLSYRLSRNGYVPPALGQVNNRGVPLVSLIFCWVIGMLVLPAVPELGRDGGARHLGDGADVCDGAGVAGRAPTHRSRPTTSVPIAGGLVLSSAVVRVRELHRLLGGLEHDLLAVHIHHRRVRRVLRLPALRLPGASSSCTGEPPRGSCPG